jgi:hypothetical protein
MPTSDDLTGLGMSPLLAAVLGNQPTGLTCTGTTAAAAAIIKTHNTALNAQSAQTAAILPAGARVGTEWFITNGTVSATSAVVFVPVGHTLFGSLGTNPVTIAQNRGAIFFQLQPKQWMAWASTGQ